MDKKKGPVVGHVVFDRGTVAGDDEGLRQLAKEREAEAERQRKRREAWPHNADSESINLIGAMSVLAKSFPGLRGRPGVEPWDAIAMLRYLCTGGGSSGEKLAARFVLGVWNAGEDWIETAKPHNIDFPEQASKFDVFDAISTWDDAHRNAFLTWCEAPFWP